MMMYQVTTRIVRFRDKRMKVGTVVTDVMLIIFTARCCDSAVARCLSVRLSV